MIFVDEGAFNDSLLVCPKCGGLQFEISWDNQNRITPIRCSGCKAIYASAMNLTLSSEFDKK